MIILSKCPLIVIIFKILLINFSHKYIRWETSDIEFNRNAEFAMISKKGYQYTNKQNIMVTAIK